MLAFAVSKIRSNGFQLLIKAYKRNDLASVSDRGQSEQDRDHEKNKNRLFHFVAETGEAI